MSSTFHLKAMILIILFIRIDGQKIYSDEYEDEEADADEGFLEESLPTAMIESSTPKVIRMVITSTERIESMMRSPPTRLWGWHAAIYHYRINDDVPRYSCGGSIIGGSSILTAAHCVSSRNGDQMEPEQIAISLGGLISDDGSKLYKVSFSYRKCPSYDNTLKMCRPLKSSCIQTTLQAITAMTLPSFFFPMTLRSTMPWSWFAYGNRIKSTFRKLLVKMAW